MVPNTVFGSSSRVELEFFVIYDCFVIAALNCETPGVEAETEAESEAGIIVVNDSPRMTWETNLPSLCINICLFILNFESFCCRLKKKI